ncbi:MAG TPA: PHB depolymerase family esterase [Candidatus Angelobacter sp.]|nr:PHB depolymerase family esterase [Candidatus Angelobacter sp.]
MTKTLCAAVWLVILLAIGTNQALAQTSLNSYNVNPNTVTVAGVSSGGFMAVQLQVAYSRSIFGTAVFAGGTYFCAQDNLLVWATPCSTGVGVPVASLVNITESQAAAGEIDPVSNIGDKPIYMFSGTLDTIVAQPAMDDLHQYYQSFTNNNFITYNNFTPAAHSWVTPNGVNACSVLAPPFINTCEIDPERTFLTMFYGALNPRHAGSLGGSFIQFNQNQFCPNGNCTSIDMDSSAWVFVPESCAQGSACRLVIALHGCLNNQQAVGLTFIQHSGINEWADGNNIVVLYPQTIASIVPANSEGCWDWWGYTGPNYALKSSQQMSAIMAEVNRLTGGQERFLTHP